MKAAPVLGTLLALVAGGMATWLHREPRHEVSADSAALETIDGLERHLTRLLEDVEALGAGRAAAPPQAQRVPEASIDPEAIEAAFQRWSQARPAPPRRSEAPSDEQDFWRSCSLDWILRQLRSSKTSDEFAALWTKLHDVGRVEEVLEEVEALRSREPENDQWHLVAGYSYIEKSLIEIDRRTEDLEKADRAFEAVLRDRPDHWEARRAKAFALTLWPALLGKGGEAIRQYELLIETQSHLPPTPRHAESFLYLGNLHFNRGDKAKAKEVWRQGLELFPESDALLEKVAPTDG